ncbi:MAG: DUF4190 domain-containing protein [Oscillospiraceae bacterium]|jgi:hypothetical protein|nr:DUF4190 domain-containing protein [Oscillospiraceae bacterium]
MGKKRRFVAEFQINQPENFVAFIANDYFAKEGFKLVDYKGEAVWKRGDGFWVARQYMKVTYAAGGAVRVEAFMRGMFGGEMDLDGVYGWAVKAKMKKEVETLISLLCQQTGTSVQTMADGTTVAAPVVAVHNPVGQANASLALGIIGCSAGWFVPFVGLSLGIVGIISASKGRKSTSKGVATVGMVFSIISIVVAAIAYIVNFIYSYAMFSGMYY